VGLDVADHESASVEEDEQRSQSCCADGLTRGVVTRPEWTRGSRHRQVLDADGDVGGDDPGQFA
jgi:hypothetical protein